MKKLLLTILPLTLCCFMGGIVAYEYKQVEDTKELRRAFLEDYNDRYILRLLENQRSELRGAGQGTRIPESADMPFVNAGYGMQIDCCHEGRTYTRTYIVSMLPEEAEPILKNRDSLPMYYRNAMLNDVKVTRGMNLSIDTCEPPTEELSTVRDHEGNTHPAVCVRFLFEDTAAGSASPSPQRSSGLYLYNGGAK